MKTAVVYYSMSGNTAYVAERISKELGAGVDLIEIKPVKTYHDKGFRKFFWGGMFAVMAEKPKLHPYSFDDDLYDRIVIGFPVWASRIAPPIRSFVEENKAALSGKRVFAYACQSGSGAEKAFGGLKELLSISGFAATAILIDPKEKPDEVNERLIEEFCGKLRE